MPTLLTRWMLFVSSYFPLAVIIAILFFQEQRILALSFLFVGLAGLLFLLGYFYIKAHRLSYERHKILSRHARGGEVMGYIASYIFPFVTFPLSGWQQIVSLLIFIGILGVVYVNSEDMLRINPTLNLLGYHLYEVTIEGGKDSYALITRRTIDQGETLHMTLIGHGIFLESIR